MAWNLGEGTELCTDSELEDDAHCSASDAMASPQEASKGGFFRKSRSSVYPLPSNLAIGDYSASSSPCTSVTPRRLGGSRPTSPFSSPCLHGREAGPLGEANNVDHEMAIEDFEMPDIDESEAWALLEQALFERQAFIDQAVQDRMGNLFPSEAEAGAEGGDAVMLMPPGDQQMEVTDVVGFGASSPINGGGGGGDFDDKAIDLDALEKAQEREEEEYRQQQQQWREQQMQQDGDGSADGEGEGKAGLHHASSAVVRFQEDADAGRQQDGEPEDWEKDDKGEDSTADGKGRPTAAQAAEPEPEAEGCLDWLFPSRKDVVDEPIEYDSGIKPSPPLLAFQTIGGAHKKLQDMTPAERHRALVQLQFEVRYSGNN